MEVTRLVLVLEILWSTCSNAEHRYSENGFDPAIWSSQYASSLYRPRTINENIYFDESTATMSFGSKPENISEQMLDLIGNGPRTEPTASPLTTPEGIPEWMLDLIGNGPRTEPTASPLTTPEGIPERMLDLIGNGPRTEPTASPLTKPESIPERMLDLIGNGPRTEPTASPLTKPESIPERMLDLIGNGPRTEATASALNEKEIVSTLLRYGQHHKYVLKTVLRGLKLLSDSSISDIQQCARDALFKVDEQQASLSDHTRQLADLEQNEEKYIVKALLTETDYMEFCVHKAAQKNMRKQVYDTLMAEMSSVIKDRQLKQLVASPNAVSSTVTIEEAELTTTSTPIGTVEQVESSTASSTISSSSDEMKVSSSSNTEGPIAQTEPPRALLDSLKVTESREDTDTSLNAERLTSGFSNQMTERYRPYTSTIPAKVYSKIPLIYRIGTIFKYVPHPYLSIFTVGEIDPNVMTGKAIPLQYPELHRAHVANKQTQSKVTKELPLSAVIDIRHNEDSTLQVPKPAPRVDTLRTVKKMLTDDEFTWPGPFAMERHHVKRSPAEFSLDVENMEHKVEPRKMVDEGNIYTESSRASKEYPLPLISEAVPVISVPGEIPDLVKEINVIKEFAEPASTVESPIVLKVQRVPTYVDTSEFWNTRKDENVQENVSKYPSQKNEEVKIQVFLDGFKATESTIMRESKILEPVTENLDEHSRDTTVTESFLETITSTQGNNKVLFAKEFGELSDESASNESVSSSEEEEANIGSTQKASDENVDVTTEQDYGISHNTEESIQVVTQTTTEMPVAPEGTTVIEGATDTTVESLANNTAETAAESTDSTSNVNITTDESGLYITDETPEVPTHATAEAETSTDSKTTALNHGTSDVTEKPTRHTISAAPVTSSEGSKTSEGAAWETTALNHGTSDVTEKPTEHTISAATATSSEDSKTSEGAAWDPDFDSIAEEFLSSHIGKHDIPDEYMDYSPSLIEELAKLMTELRARSTLLKYGRAASSQNMNITQALSPKTDEDGSTDGNKNHQSTSTVTRHLKDDKDKANMEALLTSFQEAEQKEPSPASPRSRRQAKQRELPSTVLKLLQDKGFDINALNISRSGSSARGNKIPVSPQKFSKSRTQKILLSLSEKRRNDEDDENETDSDKSDASIMELINVNRVNHILDDKKQKKA